MPFNDPDKQKHAQHESYLRNKELIAERNRIRIAKNREVARSLMTPCAECGNFDVAYMDWHHKDPSSKTGSISHIVAKNNLTRVIDEIDKCVCLCSNCHRKLHFYERLDTTEI